MRQRTFLLLLLLLLLRPTQNAAAGRGKIQLKVYIYRLVESTMYILFSLTRFPLLSARVDELDFCFFFDAGTEIFVEDHVHFIFSNGFSLVSKGRRIRFLSFLSTRAQKFLSKIGN